MKKIITSVILLFIAASVFSQNNTPGSYLRKADEAYNKKDYSKAENLYKKAEDGKVRLFYIYTKLGLCCDAQNRTEEAEAYYKQAEAHTTKGYLASKINRSSLYLRNGRYDEACELLKSTRTEGELEYRRMANLASAYMRMKDYDKALTTLNDLISMDDGSKTFTTAIQNKGFMEWEQGKLKEAEDDIQTALGRLDKDTQAYWDALSNLAVVKAEIGDATSVNDIKSVLAWQKKNTAKNSRDYIIALRKNAEVLKALGRNTEALTAFKAYFTAEKENAISTMSGMTQQNRLDYWKMIRPLISECFTLGETSPDFLYEVALFRRGVSLYSGRRIESSDKALSLSGRSIAQKLKPNEAAVEFVKYPAGNNLYEYAAVCIDNKAKCRFVPLFEESYINDYKVNWKPLKKAICSTEDFDKNSIFRDTTLAAKIWSPILQCTNAKKIYFAPDGILQMLAIENFEYKPMEGISAVRLSSTAELTKSVTASDGETLCVGGLDYNEIPEDEKTASANHDASNFLRSHSGGFFSYLSGAKVEADSIAPLIEASPKTRYTEKEAKESLSNVKYAHISTHGYSMNIDVEDAGKAYQDTLSLDQSLLGCGIALTGANKAYRIQGIDDGLLSAREVSDLDLTKLDFIVLSACQTAQGTISDEGPAGMLRGLKIAGAHSIIATLWPVDDNATALFMTEFYKAWQKGAGMSKQDALETARNAVKNHVKKVPKTEYKFDPAVMRKRWVPIPGTEEDYYPYLAPYYWAGFIATDMNN